MSINKNFIFQVTGNSTPPTPPPGAIYFIAFENDPRLYSINSFGTVSPAFDSNGGGTVPAVITNATVISAIVDESNWDGDFTDPGGILNSLQEGNFYLDINLGIKYEYLSNTLIRTKLNSSFLLH